MLAHDRDKNMNTSNLPIWLPVKSREVTGHLDLLAGVLLVQRLPAWHRNVSKRLVKAPPRSAVVWV